MPEDFTTAMGRARDLVRAGKPFEATRLIQSALGQTTAPAIPVDMPADMPADIPVDMPDKTAPAGKSDAAPRRPLHPDPSSLPDAELAATPLAPKLRSAPVRPRRPLGDVITGLTKGRPVLPAATPAEPDLTFPEGASFGWRSITTSQGNRDYRLYIPATRPLQGLVVMLHGCTQNPDDFATGTAMNTHAETRGLLVAYPAQTRSQNAQSCWNWFRPADQLRGTGEPAILAALAQEIAAEFHLPAGRVFAAGLSAGGAMAAILGQTYPDVFAAVGVHSGLAAGSASDVVSAFAAMRGEAQPPKRQAKGARTITFHGTADTTVHPSNSAQIIAAARKPGAKTVSGSDTANGRRFTRSQTLGEDGIPLTEQIEIAGSGHAWSGGSAKGSFTDPTGPDASALMLRFFLATSDAGKGT